MTIEQFIRKLSKKGKGKFRLLAGTVRTKTNARLCPIAYVAGVTNSMFEAGGEALGLTPTGAERIAAAADGAYEFDFVARKEKPIRYRAALLKAVGLKETE